MSKHKILFIALYIAGIAVFFTHQTDDAFFLNQFVYLIGPITASATGLLVLTRMGWISRRAVSVGWVWGAVTLWLLAEMVYIYLAYQGLELYPSLADLLFISGFVGFAIALIFELRLFNLKLSNIPAFRLSFLVLAFTAALTFFTYIAFNSYDETVSWFVNLVTLSWSIGDIITGGLSLLLLGLIWDYQGGTIRYEWLWIMLALTANFVGDTIYSLNPDVIASVTTTGTALNCVWFLGYFFFAMYFMQVHKDVTELQNKINTLSNN